MDAAQRNGGNGQFVPGHKGGPGRGKGSRDSKLWATLRAELKTEDVKVIARALIDKAREGNLHAVELCLDRYFGKPLPALPPDPERMEVLLTWAE